MIDTLFKIKPYALCMNYLFLLNKILQELRVHPSPPATPPPCSGRSQQLEGKK